MLVITERWLTFVGLVLPSQSCSDLASDQLYFQNILAQIRLVLK
jgi:hypothetical protein